VTGRLRFSKTGVGTQLTIGGSAAARGRLRLTVAGALEGELGGKHVETPLAMTRWRLLRRPASSPKPSWGIDARPIARTVP
jgi:hypothetical protein